MDNIREYLNLNSSNILESNLSENNLNNFKN